MVEALDEGGEGGPGHVSGQVCGRVCVLVAFGGTEYNRQVLLYSVLQ